MRYRFIEKQQKAWPITLMCGVLGVSRSGYYDWTARDLRQGIRSNIALDKRIREIFTGVIGNAMVRPGLPMPYVIRASSAARTALPEECAYWD